MSMTIRAPYPGMTTTSILPNPQLGNTENLKQTLDIHRSMTGVKRTYVVTPDRVKFVYTFKLTRMKALELEEFIKAYSGNEWLITDYLGNQWVVVLQNNPFDSTSQSRSTPGRETVSVTMELEGREA